MNHVDIALIARSFSAGRGIRRCTVRHRRLERDPIGIAMWQFGAEPFSPGAIGWGHLSGKPVMAVPGEPRNRALTFAALLRFARWFNPRFEAHADDRETFTRGETSFTRARTAPQVVVANRGTVEMIGRLGRRLAYLPSEGEHAGEPDLIRLGRHLRFLWTHSSVPGQQLILSMTDLMNAHWATAQADTDRQSLAGLEAFVDPQDGEDGFEASRIAEVSPFGPTPTGEDEERLNPLVAAFNRERKGSTDPAVVSPLFAPIAAHYAPLLRRSWDALCRCRSREALLPEAASVARRWDEDRDTYTRYIDWLEKGGHRRTRQTPRQAVMTLRNLEGAGRRVEAEEACDDPLRMAGYILSDKAVLGTVVAVDLGHREPGGKRSVSRPLVTLRSADPCLIPVGRELWWTAASDGREYAIDEVVRGPDGGSDVVLKRMTGDGKTPLPQLGDVACFSIHSTSPRRSGELPASDPWTHRAQSPPVAPIEEILTEV